MMSTASGISNLSNSTRLVIEAEKVRQRIRRLFPLGALKEEKDYKTIVHTLPLDRVSATLKTKFPTDLKCQRGPAGLKEEQARIYFSVHGKNQITPPQRENIWIKLLKQTFGGIFNVLLWFCVVAEVALIIMFPGPSPEERALLMSKGLEVKDADYVTPIILSSVIVMAALLQWYSEIQAESQMEAMQQMQSAQKVPTVRINAKGERMDLELDPVNLVPGDIIFLEAGNRIPADVRILYCSDGMEVDNSALTGESMPEPRHTRTEPAACPPTDPGTLLSLAPLC